MKFKITSSGRAALINAQNNGTTPTTIALLGMTETAFDPDLVSTLPDTFKTTTAFSGENIGDQTIHVHLTDASTDAYTLRGAALYLDNGILFALCGDPDAGESILVKTAASSAAASFDVQLVELTNATITFASPGITNPPASETTLGVVRRASTVHATGGADDTAAMTSAKTKAQINSRFGADSPSGFIKSLLSIASAVALRLALGIKSAGLKDDGHGNNLDADFLDGQHGSYYNAWVNMTGVPNDFNPALHGHDGNQITGRLGMVAQYIGDWNTVLTNGWFMSLNALNSPVAGWLIGEVVAHNADWVTQTVFRFEIDHRLIYRRQRSAGSWGAWELCIIHQSALDLRYAQLASPVFTGVPTAPTAAANTSNMQLANTAFVQAAISAALNSYLPKNNPTFTGTLTGPDYNKVP